MAPESGAVEEKTEEQKTQELLEDFEKKVAEENESELKDVVDNAGHDEEESQTRRKSAIQRRLSSVRLLDTRGADTNKILDDLYKFPKVNCQRDLDGDGFSFSEEAEKAGIDDLKRIRTIPNNVLDVAIPDEIPFPGDFDLADFNRKRGEVKYFEYTPRKFTRTFLRANEDFEEGEKLTKLDMIGVIPFQMLTFVWLDDLRSTLSEQESANVLRTVSQCANCEVLSLRNAGITKMEGLVLPKLLYCDLGSNDIRELQQLIVFARNTRKIQRLSVDRNPISQNQEWFRSLPEPGCNAWALLPLLPDLKLLNGSLLKLKHHVDAVLAYGNATATDALALRVFDAAFQARTEEALATMGTSWQPDRLVTLDLRQCGLNRVHVGVLRGLKTLLLRGNQLRTLQHSGLEQLSSLSVLDVSTNQLGERGMEDVDPITYLTSLLELDLRQNPLQNYRYVLLHVTRHLRGSLKQAGLQKLDGEEVTIEDRLQAVSQSVKELGAGPANELRFRLGLARSVGRHALRALGVPEACGQLRQLLLPDMKLVELPLDILPKLEVLDASGNLLTSVLQLDTLTELRVVDLSRNPKLKVKRVTKQLSQLTHLQDVAYQPSTADADNKKQRRTVLSKLLPLNPLLAVLEARPISAEERVGDAKASKRVKGSTALRDFHVDVCLVEDCVGAVGRSYAVDQVVKGVQYQPEEVTELIRMSGRGFVSGQLGTHLLAFKQLQRLNLSRNALTKADELGLEMLPELRVLDLSFNKIGGKPSVLGALLDLLLKLEVVNVKGNPCMDKSASRLKLMGAITRLRKVPCTLRVIDTKIEPLEKVAAWKQAGGTVQETEHLRTVVAIRDRVDQDVTDESVRTIDLTGLQLLLVDMASYTGLQKLNLRGNLLTSLNIGLEYTPLLMVLDVRDNKLALKDDKEMTAALGQMSKLKHLTALGLSGNKSCPNQDPKYRLRAFRALPQLHQVDCALRFLDDNEITPDEIVASQAHKTKEQREHNKEFRFDLANFRLLAGRATADVGSVDFSDLKLELVKLQPYTHLKVLDLHSNLLSWKALNAGGLGDLHTLQDLDISWNTALSLAELAEVFSSLPNLSSFGCQGCKGCKDNSFDARVAVLCTMEGVEDIGFRLKELNGSAVDVQERLAAMRAIAGMSGTVPRYSSSGAAFGGRRSSGGSHARRPESITMVPVGEEGGDEGSAGAAAIVPVGDAGSIPGSPGGKRRRPKSIELREDEGSGTSSPGRGRASTTRPASRGFRSGAAKVDTVALARSQLMVILESKGIMMDMERDLEVDDDGYEVETLDLQGYRLFDVSYLLTCPRFDALKSLSLRNNAFKKTTQGQKLHMLPNLASLDLRDNQFPSVQAVCGGLLDCNSLRTLYLANCTASKALTSDVSKYLGLVCRTLRGLDTVDGKSNPTPLTKDQVDAAFFLNQVADVSINNLNDIDLKDRRLPHKSFFWILGALRELPVDKLRLEGNFRGGVGPSRVHYRRYVIPTMGPTFKTLDGVLVTDDERANLIKFLHDDAAKHGEQVKKDKWSLIKGQAAVACAVVISKQAEKHAYRRTLREAQAQGGGGGGG